jgi:two-component system, OmpR family, phosphate regulon sensor histidine kinase PhoR
VEPPVVASLILAVIAIVAGWLAIRRARDLQRATALIGRIRAEDTLAAQARDAERADDHLLHDLLSSGVLLVDDGMRITEANAPAHVLLSRGPGTLVGRTLMEAFLDQRVEGLARAARIDGTTTTAEAKLADIDGPTLVVRAQRLPDGRVWLVLDDVSELRRLQRIRTEFIDNLSHELRTPLTTVSLLAETLSRDAETAGDAVPARMRERIAKVEVETGHLVQMVNELLDLSRIEGGGTLDLVDGIDMGALAAESAERLRLFADRQGVTLKVEPGSGLPTIRGDRARLGQVVVNLVHNAVKFSPDGGDVVVRTSAARGEVVTAIQDHGVGIPRAAQARVFERFYKVDRARQRGEAGGGTGLGLAIARHVIQQHQGRIWVDSVDGVGSTFCFALPVAPDATATD